MNTRKGNNRQNTIHVENTTEKSINEISVQQRRAEINRNEVKVVDVDQVVGAK